MRDPPDLLLELFLFCAINQGMPPSSHRLPSLRFGKPNRLGISHTSTTFR
ncbi:MAG: hypothetical protein RIB86_20635 [Imperialibacter sp.]